MQFLIVLVVLALVVVLVSAPLRRVRSGDDQDSVAASERAELEAAREAKYREIRDAELDYRTGKLSEADYRAIDQTLRAEATGILRALDRVSD